MVTTNATVTYDCESPAVTTGTSGFTDMDMRSCLSTGMFSGPRTIFWDTGDESVLDLETMVVTVGGVTTVTKTGTVVSGLFAGANVLEILVGPEIATMTECLTSSGLQETFEQATLTITPVA